MNLGGLLPPLFCQAFVVEPQRTGSPNILPSGRREMAVKTGERASELISRIKGYDADVKSFVGMVVGVFLLTGGLFFLAIDLDSSSWAPVFVFAAIIPAVGLIILLIVIMFHTHADPQEFVEAFKMDNKSKDVSEMEILEKAYSTCRPFVKEGFEYSLASWLLLSIWASLLEVGATTGNIAIRNWSAFGLCFLFHQRELWWVLF
ncbi:hypothetical protein E3E36_04055 [Thermococcus sp. M36]|uniref:hypothetical protein n=1 Tax=Thermococcus sp. M36 TaxID=1638261 RepID=UPI00143C0807|nr:hypothetical protein [Thermococcus sp. M36]NJE05326.1 hypothetical protein [Thermococcus sp. M36]